MAINMINQVQALQAGTGAPPLRRTRRWWLAAGAVSTPALLAACGAGGSTQGLPPASKPTGTVEFWHQWSTRQPALRVYLDQFERENAGVKVTDVEMGTIGAAGSDRTKIVTSILSGSVPDNLMVFNNMYHLVVPSKAVVSLNKYVARDKVDMKLFVDADVKNRTFDGQLVAMPSASGATGAVALYWNKAHFKQAGLDPEKPPQTWTQLEQHATRLTVGSGESLQQLGATVPGFSALLYANDGKLFSDDGKKVAFNNKEGRDTLEWMVQLVRRLGGPPPAALTGRPGFFQGKLSMFHEIDLFPGLLRADANGMSIDWGISTIAVNDRNPKAKLAAPSSIGHGYSIPTAAKNPEGSWALIKFLTMSDAQCGFTVKDQGRISPLRKCNVDPGTAARPEFKVFSRQLETMVPVAYAPGETTAGTAISKYVNDALTLKISVEDAITQAAREAQTALDEGWQQWRT